MPGNNRAQAAETELRLAKKAAEEGLKCIAGPT
jgi:hypothetical protein